MDGELWFEKYADDPTIKSFLAIFGGYFVVDIECDLVFYESKDTREAYETPFDETAFMDMVTRSIKTETNLFINQPIFESYESDEDRWKIKMHLMGRIPCEDYDDILNPEIDKWVADHANTVACTDCSLTMKGPNGYMCKAFSLYPGKPGDVYFDGAPCPKKRVKS